MEINELEGITRNAFGKGFDVKSPEGIYLEIWDIPSNTMIAMASLTPGMPHDVFIKRVHSDKQRRETEVHEGIRRLAMQYEAYGLRVMGASAGSYGAH